jgi:hypothetical protein
MLSSQYLSEKLLSDRKLRQSLASVDHKKLFDSSMDAKAGATMMPTRSSQNMQQIGNMTQSATQDLSNEFIYSGIDQEPPRIVNKRNSAEPGPRSNDLSFGKSLLSQKRSHVANNNNILVSSNDLSSGPGKTLVGSGSLLVQKPFNQDMQGVMKSRIEVYDDKPMTSNHKS